MRLLHTLTAVVLAASTVLTVAPQHADACGGSYGEVVVPAPRIHLVSTHSSMGAPRAFIVLGASDVTTTEGEWTRLWPHSYDHTRVRVLGPANGRAFTLVGPSGRRIAKTSQSVLISGTFTLGAKTQHARELAVKRGEDFAIALEGVHKDATWVELEAIGFSSKALFAAKPQFELRHGETSYGTYEGYAVGALQTGGRTYLVTQDGNGTASALWIL